jgi:two-component system phosphate regulon sensor histidine kinase PhoR
MDARKINMWASISPVVTAGVAGLLIGGLLGFWGWGLAIGLCLYQLYFLWSIQRFKAWYNKTPDEPPPAFESNLNVIASNIYQVNRQEKLAHQQTVSIVKNVRDSLSALKSSFLLFYKHDCIEWWNNSAERLFILKRPTKVAMC